MRSAQQHWITLCKTLFLTTLSVVLGPSQSVFAGNHNGCNCGLHDPGFAQPCPHCCTPNSPSAPLNNVAEGASPAVETTTPPPSVDLGFQSLDSAPPAESVPSLGFTEQSAAFAGTSFAAMPTVGGYIDDAVIRNRVRVRYDHAKNSNFPDRAEYIYPIGSQFGGRGPAGFGGGDIGSVDIQEIHTYIEWAWSSWFSVFGDFPVRFVNADSGSGAVFNDPISGEASDTVAGAGDFSAGFRVALIADPDEYLTAQFKVYTPTGDPDNGLGTGHTSVEAGLLYQRRYANRWTLFGEFTDWAAINASRFSSDGGGLAPNNPLVGSLAAGNVLRYGVGVGYDLWCSSDCCQENRLIGVFEVVGWSVLEGFKSNGDTLLIDADGDTIINGKYGFRYNFGQNSLYAGYATRWTEQVWYTDLVRIELAHYF